jgi:hypothetical protein
VEVRSLQKRNRKAGGIASEDLRMNPSGTTRPAPLALRPREAAKMLGISHRYLWTLSQQGRIPCVYLSQGKRNKSSCIP